MQVLSAELGYERTPDFKPVPQGAPIVAKNLNGAMKAFLTTPQVPAAHRIGLLPAVHVAVRQPSLRAASAASLQLYSSSKHVVMAACNNLRSLHCCCTPVGQSGMSCCHHGFM